MEALTLCGRPSNKRAEDNGMALEIPLAVAELTDHLNDQFVLSGNASVTASTYKLSNVPVPVGMLLLVTGARATISR